MGALVQGGVEAWAAHNTMHLHSRPTTAPNPLTTQPNSSRCPMLSWQRPQRLCRVILHTNTPRPQAVTFL